MECISIALQHTGVSVQQKERGTVRAVRPGALLTGDNDYLSQVPELDLFSQPLFPLTYMGLWQ